MALVIALTRSAPNLPALPHGVSHRSSPFGTGPRLLEGFGEHDRRRAVALGRVVLEVSAEHICHLLERGAVRLAVADHPVEREVDLDVVVRRVLAEVPSGIDYCRCVGG
jgi:hypothetical protein